MHLEGDGWGSVEGYLNREHKRWKWDCHQTIWSSSLWLQGQCHRKSLIKDAKDWSLSPQVCCLVAKSCLTLCDPMDCNLPGSSAQEFFMPEYRVSCHFLLKGIFLDQISNLHLLGLLHRQADSLSLSHLGSPEFLRTLPITLRNLDNHMIDMQ